MGSNGTNVFDVNETVNRVPGTLVSDSKMCMTNFRLRNFPLRELNAGRA